MPKPKDALIYLIDDIIVSGFSYKLYEALGKKIGFANYFFTDPEHHGKGIGKELCKEGVKHLWDVENCNMLITFVRDDNVGSWLNFVKNGFVRIPFLKLLPHVGFLSFLKIYAFSTFGICFGHDFYIAKKEETVQEESSSLGQIVLFALVNAVLFIPVFMTSRYIHLALAIFLSVFIGQVFFGFIGTLFTKRKWRFRFTDGGLILLGVVSFGAGFMPMIGNWYPHEYENTPEFRRDMAIVSIASWLFLFAIGVVWPPTVGLVSILLIYRCIFFIGDPLKSYGGQRVYDWSRGAFALIMAISVLFVFRIF